MTSRYTSRYAIDQEVIVTLEPENPNSIQIAGKVTAVKFTIGKVYYDVVQKHAFGLEEQFDGLPLRDVPSDCVKSAFEEEYTEFREVASPATLLIDYDTRN